MNKKEFLKNTNNIPHALAVEGASAALRLEAVLDFAILASCINAECKPCGICSSCKKIKENIHPDVKIVSSNGSATIKIDQIRTLRSEAYVIPNENKYKIFIIEDANLMTVQAQNAFIKILEEPPKNVIFALVCESVNPLLETIRSRVQIFTLDFAEKEFDEEVLNIAEKLTQAAISDKKTGLMEAISKIQNNRAYFKSVLSLLLKKLVQACSAESSKEKQRTILKKIESVKYIIGQVDKNINFNLLVSYLCANTI